MNINGRNNRATQQRLSCSTGINTRHNLKLNLLQNSSPKGFRSEGNSKQLNSQHNKTLKAPKLKDIAKKLIKN